VPLDEQTKRVAITGPRQRDSRCVCQFHLAFRLTKCVAVMDGVSYFAKSSPLSNASAGNSAPQKRNLSAS
jgi:hypothetical protein